jgi:hypothetical protein
MPRILDTFAPFRLRKVSWRSAHYSDSARVVCAVVAMSPLLVFCFCRSGAETPATLARVAEARRNNTNVNVIDGLEFGLTLGAGDTRWRKCTYADLGAVACDAIGAQQVPAPQDAAPDFAERKATKS